MSQVLNDRPNVRPTTRERVLRAIEARNQRPNSVAWALATRKTNRIGVLVDSPVEDGPNSTLRGFESAARVTGYSVTAVVIRRSTVPTSAIRNRARDK